MFVKYLKYFRIMVKVTFLNLVEYKALEKSSSPELLCNFENLDY